MLVHKAYKFRLYPSKEQSTLINKTIGSSRYIYNHFLNCCNEHYKSTGKNMGYKACSNMLPALKKDEKTHWLSEVDSIALQSSLRNLSDAFDRFFKKQNERPRFKSKKNPVQSYTTKYTNNNIRITHNKIKLPKLGFVKFAKSKEISGRIINATIRRNPSGKYFVSLLCECEVEVLKNTGNSVGIDLGISHFATLSNGTKIDNNRFTSKMEKKLKREQRKLSRRQKQALDSGRELWECKNYQKQRIIVARLHEKVANQREDFLSKLSTDIVKNHDIICIEDLNVKGMVKNHKLAKSISDVSWSAFVNKLKYKASWYGKEIVTVSRWHPSSKICSSCGERKEELNLSVREWECECCQCKHDRDVNAAKNILAEGLRLIS